VAKFEASRSDAVAIIAGDINAPSEGTSTTVAVKPNVTSWRSISMNDIFNNCRSMENNNIYGWGTTGTGIDTHMMKNIEWGAVAYLAQSVFGKNSEIYANSNTNYITGISGDTVTNSGSAATTNIYSTAQGVLASTTGNVYGIYDMSGGSFEYVSAYLNNTNASTNIYINIIRDADIKYKDIYAQGVTDDYMNNYEAAKTNYGDAIYETSLVTSAFSPCSWYSDTSKVPSGSNCVFYRGGKATSSQGLFAFQKLWFGDPGIDTSFRPVLLINSAL
jgi:hypothetical protein